MNERPPRIILINPRPNGYAMIRKKTVTTTASALGLIVLAVIVGGDYAGTIAFRGYGKARSRVRSIQSGLPELERRLLKAVHTWPRRLFFEELGNLYFDAALAEIQFGSEDKRESLLDKARDVLLEEVRRYPAAADGYFNLGRVYMTYNYPYLTSAAKGREYLKKALILQPADEYLNTNILAVMLSQWEILDPAERKDVRSRLRKILENNEAFISKILNIWEKNNASIDDLKKILSADAELWPRMQKFF